MQTREDAIPSCAESVRADVRHRLLHSPFKERREKKGYDPMTTA